MRLSDGGRLSGVLDIRICPYSDAGDAVTGAEPRCCTTDCTVRMRLRLRLRIGTTHNSGPALTAKKNQAQRMTWAEVRRLCPYRRTSCPGLNPGRPSTRIPTAIVIIILMAIIITPRMAIVYLEHTSMSDPTDVQSQRIRQYAGANAIGWQRSGRLLRRRRIHSGHRLEPCPHSLKPSRWALGSYRVPSCLTP